MQKVSTYCKIIVLISTILISFILIRKGEINQDEFEIFQIYTLKGGDYTRTQINVIVYVSEYDIDEMCKKQRMNMKGSTKNPMNF